MPSFDAIYGYANFRQAKSILLCLMIIPSHEQAKQTRQCFTENGKRRKKKTMKIRMKVLGITSFRLKLKIGYKGDNGNGMFMS